MAASEALYVREALTSASVVHGDGSLVVFGGVPRGAVVSSGSDIVVFGQCAAVQLRFLACSQTPCAQVVCSL